MYKIVSSSQDPLQGDTWQNSALKDYEWVVLQTVKTEENQGQESSPALLVLNPLVSNESSQTSEQNKVTIIKELYQCETCKRKFKRKNPFYDHKCERTNKLAECEICHQKFFDSGTLLRHVKLHSGIKPFQCELCHQSFTRKDNYNIHCKSQICTKPASYSGIRKKRVFKRVKKFKQKMPIAEYQEVFECEVCHKTFSRKTSLNVHQRIHLPFKCNICNNAFSMKRQVLVHLGTHKSLELSKRTLGWRFVLEDSDVNNCPMNTTETKANHAFQCKICQRPFTLRNILVEHERVHTGERPFECDICYKRFSSQSNLTIHRRRHTGERPYQCPLCPKAFVEKTKLNRHARFHAGVKPYECEFCCKKFSEKVNWRNHSRIHTGEKPFECDICHKTFIEKRSCSRHRQKHFN